MPLCRHSVGTCQEMTHATRQRTRPQSSRLTGPLWTDPGLKTGISVRDLISTKKKKKKRKEKKEMQAGNELSNILPKSSYARKKPPPQHFPSPVCGRQSFLSNLRVNDFLFQKCVGLLCARVDPFHSRWLTRDSFQRSALIRSFVLDWAQNINEVNHFKAH